MQTEIALYAVKDLIPGFLDVAGMRPEAEMMRRADLHGCDSVDEAVAAIRQARDSSSGRWAPLVEEVCFWAEAMVWASWDQDAHTMEECRKRLDRTIADGYRTMAVH